MKLYKFLPVLMLFFVAACNNAPERPEPLLDQTQTASPVTPAATLQTPAGTATALPVVNHYICPNNCAGSGGPNAGTCPVCGTTYTHNA
ncbi:MAG: hypothetical protein KJO29_11705, partial [Bacteroidia bacterium]|nr:hypothetical protein [Bacteroidia bacterium]